jgi:hypothetical protein
MPRTRILAFVAALVIVVVMGTFLLGRYLTPSVQQRIVEQQAVPAATALP